MLAWHVNNYRGDALSNCFETPPPSPLASTRPTALLCRSMVANCFLTGAGFRLRRWSLTMAGWALAWFLSTRPAQLTNRVDEGRRAEGVQFTHPPYLWYAVEHTRTHAHLWNTFSPSLSLCACVCDSQNNRFYLFVRFYPILTDQTVKLLHRDIHGIQRERLPVFIRHWFVFYAFGLLFCECISFLLFSSVDVIFVYVCVFWCVNSLPCGSPWVDQCAWEFSMLEHTSIRIRWTIKQLLFFNVVLVRNCLYFIRITHFVAFSRSIRLQMGLVLLINWRRCYEREKTHYNYICTCHKTERS